MIAACDAHLVLGHAAVDLRDLAHDLERDFEEQLTDLLRRALASQARAALVELMAEKHAEHGADRTARDQTDDPADGLTEPLHPRSESAVNRCTRELVQGCREAPRRLIISAFGCGATR